MGRPNKPHWSELHGCWRCRVGGTWVYFRPGLVAGFEDPIGRSEEPAVLGVPLRAWQLLDAYKRARSGAAVALADPTVATVADAYLAFASVESRAGRLSPEHVAAQTVHLSRFAEWSSPRWRGAAGGRRAASLEVRDLAEFSRWLSDRYTAHYVADICRSIQRAMNWAVESGLLRSNPVAGFSPPRPAKESGKYRPLSELRRFLRWAWKRATSKRRGSVQRRHDLAFVRALWFLALTGARPGEVCSLRWDHVDLVGRIAVLEEWKGRRSTGRLREIHLTPGVVRLLRRLERLEEHHPIWVFTHALRRADRETSREGSPWNSVAFAAKIRAWRAEYGDESLTAYLFRHAYISDGLMAGLSEAEVAHLAGTSAQMVASTYGHIQREHAAERAAELAERRRGGTKPPR